MSISFFDPARAELEDTVRYYERQRPGLGDEFAEEVQKTLDLIARHPGIGTDLGGAVRRRRTDRFPYGIVYITEGDTLFIVAVMHLRRKPGYWADRL